MNSNTPAQTHPRQETAAMPDEMSGETSSKKTSSKKMPSEKKEPSAAWREFAAGMAFLRQYGIHNTANASDISRDNLRLLHRALLQDSEYRHLVTSARRQAPRLTRPHWLPLTTSRQLHAHLVSMPANSSIRLTTQPGYLGMFLVLSGSAETINRTGTAARLRHSWWPHGWFCSRQPPASTHNLKTNDVVCVNHDTANPGLLVTGKKACIVLAVFTTQHALWPTPAAVSNKPQVQQTSLSSAI